MKDIIHDKDGKLSGSKTAFWVVLIACLIKMFMQEAPDYAGISLFMAPFVAAYLGRSYIKAKSNVIL